jgi:hypothetical protein
MEIKCYEEADYDNYAFFAEKNFGVSSYQKNKSYIGYNNVIGEGLLISRGIKILKTQEEIIGCYHYSKYSTKKLNLTEEFTVIYNLMVDSAHRNYAGLHLIGHFRKNHKNFLIPGASGELAELYKKMGALLVEAYWSKVFVLTNPIALIKNIAFNEKSIISASNNQDCNIKTLTVKFALIQNLFSKMDFNKFNLNIRDFLQVVELRKSLADRVMFSRDGKSFIIYSTGKRKGIPVLRVIYGIFDNLESGVELFSKIKKKAFLSGYLFVLVTGNFIGNVELFLKCSPERYSNTFTLWYGEKSLLSVINNFWPLLSDLGFEEYFGG